MRPNDPLAGHPLGFALDMLDYLETPAAHRPGVAAALAHFLYGLRSDELLVEHLAHHALVRAFVGERAAGWDLGAYQAAREAAAEGGWDGPLGLALTQARVSMLMQWPPLTPDPKVIEGWIEVGGPTFEDLATMTDRQVQAAVRHLDIKDVLLALVDAPAGVRARIDANVSVRMRRIIADELGYMGPVRPEDVAAIRKRLARQLRGLKACGKLEP